jgi:hypothetical protein
MTRLELLQALTVYRVYEHQTGDVGPVPRYEHTRRAY